jgi:hypothetical protein
MQQQERDEQAIDSKRNFNILFSFCRIHQLGLVIPLRRGWGVNALGMQCFWALILMLAWAGFSHDPYMIYWVGLWLIFYLVRKAEAEKLKKQGARVHSYYDGWPEGNLVKWGGSERNAKMIVEPVFMLIAGGVLFLFYQDTLQLPPYGLPYYFLLGGITLPFVEGVKQAIWEKRTQDMMDMQLEQEQTIRDFRDRFGDS